MLPFLGIGSAIGAVFTAVVFFACAFSLSMIIDRKLDSITAVVTSVDAVLLPLIGHATCHAYQETIDAPMWPQNEAMDG